MANYDIIGGIVSPKALEELKALETMVDNIATKLQGMTIGQAAGKSSDAGLNKTINKLQKEIERLNAAKKQGLTIDQKVEQNSQRLQQKYEAIANSSSKYVTELQKMEARMKLLNIELQKLVASGQTESKAYLDKMAAIKQLSTQYDLMAKASGVAQMRNQSMYGATFQLTQVMRELPNFAIDARIGFMSLSNNLPMLVDSFKLLSQQIDATTGKAYGSIGALKIFAKSLLSVNTIMIVASTLLVLYGKDIVDWISNVSDAEKAQREFIKSLKEGNGEFGEANKKISETTAILQAAKNGYIDSKDAVDKYNETLGDTLGKANNLEEAYQNVIDKGDDYIEVMFRMQLANSFLAQSQSLIGEAAALAANDTVTVWDIAFVRLQKLINAFKLGINGLANLMSGNLKLAAADFALFSHTLERGYEAEEILNKRNEKSNELREKSKKLLEEYKLAMMDAFAFAKDKNIDLFPGDIKQFDKYNKRIADLTKEIEKLDDIINAENVSGFENSVSKRLQALEMYYRKSLDLLDEQKKEEEEKAEGNKEELQRIEDKYYLKSLEAFRNYKKQQISILKNADKEYEEQLKAQQKLQDEIQESAVDSWLDKFRKSKNDYLKEVQDRAKEELQIEKEKEQLKKRLLTDSVTAIIELTTSLYEIYFQKLDEQREKVSKIEDEKLKEVEDKEKAGILTKTQAEEDKARISAYYQSVQDELDRKQKEKEREAFLFKQAAALAEVWINYAQSVASLENLLAAGAFTPLYTALALVSTGIIAAQTIPMFADGGEMQHSGKAILGDGGKNELAILPDGRMFVTPDVPTIYNIPKGTEILPDVNSIDMHSLLGRKQMITLNGSDNKDIILELRDVKKAIKNQKSGNFYGMPLIRQLNQSERFYYRKQSLRN